MYRSNDVPQDWASRDDTGVVRDQSRNDLCRNTRGKLGEYSDANTGRRSPCPNIHPKNVWMKIRIHFGDEFSASSEESCFFGSFAFLPFG
jgi:hypothetical protein